MLKERCYSFGFVLFLFMIFPLLVFAQDMVQSRALFFSTAGTSVSTSPNVKTTKIERTVITHTNTTVIEPKKNYLAAKDETLETKLNENIPSGINILVEKVYPNGKIVAVNPSIYKFHTGDKFFVQFQTNLPGMVSITNISPVGNQAELIPFTPIPAFQLVRLPAAPQNFQFENTPGLEKLVFQFLPCRNNNIPIPNQKEIIASRSINLVGSPSNTVENSALSSLSSCPTTNSEIHNTVASRSIQLTGGSYENNSSYYVQPASLSEPTPITVILKMTHEN